MTDQFDILSKTVANGRSKFQCTNRQSTEKKMNYSELLRRGKEEFSSASDRLRAILSDTARALLIAKKLAKPDAEKYYISSKVASLFLSLCTFI